MPERVYIRPLLDKLGVMLGARVAILNLDEPWFVNLVEARTRDVTIGSVAPPADLVFLGADSPADLARLSGLRPGIHPNGAIWVVSRKGRAATIRDVDVIDGAIQAGLVDNKVVSFSDTQTSLRLVIPLRDRPRA